jgi:hypothetical protein
MAKSDYILISGGRSSMLSDGNSTNDIESSIMENSSFSDFSDVKGSYTSNLSTSNLSVN